MNYNQLETSTKVILKVIFALLALLFLWVVRDIILILLLSLILASAMDPMVDYLSQKKIPRAASVLTVYVLVFGILGLSIYALIPLVASQISVFRENLPLYLEQIQQYFGLKFVEQNTISSVLKEMFSNISENRTVVSKTFGIFNGLFSFVTVLVISFYLVAEEKGMKKFVETLIPQKHQDFTMGLLEKVQKKMGLWILGQIILSVAIFLITLAGLLVVGMISSAGGSPNAILSNAVILALFAGILEIVPYIGPFISVIPAAIIAFTVSPFLGLVVFVMYVFIQKTEGYVLVPKIMSKTVGTSPLVVLLSLLVGLKLAGVVGLLISVPLVSALTVIINEFLEAKK